MKSPTFLLATSCALLLGACGEKLEPGTPFVDPTSVTVAPATTPAATDPNAASAGGNVPADPNAGNANTGVTPTPVAANLCGTNSATIGYAAFASVSIKRSCATSGCHAAKQPVMSDFATSQTVIKSQGLAAIKQGSMPLTPYPDPNDKCIITAWADGGYLP